MVIISYVRINGNVSTRIPLGIEVESKAELIALKAKLEHDWAIERGDETAMIKDRRFGIVKTHTIGFETKRKPNEKHLFGAEI
jgi:hypothetical protein